MGNDTDTIGPETIGDVIRGARTKLGFSLRDVTGQLDITPSYLCDIENNRRVPSEDVLRQIADLLKLDYDDLMARAGRFGADAIRYMQRTPSAGVLLRRLAQAKAPRETVEKLIAIAEREIRKNKPRGDKSRDRRPQGRPRETRDTRRRGGNKQESK